MALPSHQEIALLGGGVAVETALPDGNYIVSVGSNDLTISAGWVSSGGAIVGAVEIAPNKFAGWDRYQAGGAPSIFVASALAGTAILILEELGS